MTSTGSSPHRRTAGLVCPTGRLPWLAIAAAVLCACQGHSDAHGLPGPVAVRTAAVTVEDVPLRLSAVGTVESIHTVRVISQVTGMVQRAHFEDGALVRQGDLLVTIDTRPYAVNLAAAQAQVTRDQALARQAEEEAARARQLAASKLASAQDLSRAEAAAAAAEASLRAGEAEVRSAALDVQFAQIRSPIDGRTGRLLVMPGNVVKANENQPLVVIRSLVPIRVEFSVPEEYLPTLRRRLAAGSVAVAATPRGDGAVTARGHLTFIDNTVDPSTGTISLHAEFTNEAHELWPGQFVNVTVELGVDRGVAVVPDAAIQVGQDGAFAFVVGADGKAHLRAVTVRRTVGTRSVIASGLRAGERVVVDGQVKLRDGAAVAPTAAGSPAASGAASAGESGREPTSTPAASVSAPPRSGKAP